MLSRKTTLHLVVCSEQLGRSVGGTPPELFGLPTCCPQLLEQLLRAEVAAVDLQCCSIRDAGPVGVETSGCPGSSSAPASRAVLSLSAAAAPVCTSHSGTGAFR